LEFLHAWNVEDPSNVRHVTERGSWCSCSVHIQDCPLLPVLSIAHVCMFRSNWLSSCAQLVLRCRSYDLCNCYCHGFARSMLSSRSRVRGSPVPSCLSGTCGS
jgi:hypothetical protein